MSVSFFSGVIFGNFLDLVGLLERMRRNRFVILINGFILFGEKWNVMLIF